MNKFTAINTIRSKDVMKKPVKDTFEFTLKEKTFAVITKGEDKKYYIHRPNQKMVTANNFMKAVAMILTDYMAIVAEIHEMAIKATKNELNRYKMAYERSIKSHNLFIAIHYTGMYAMGTGNQQYPLYDVENIFTSDYPTTKFKITLGEALSRAIRLYEQSLKNLENSLDETLVSL
ncbi:hypothetical protein [Salmonella phage SUT_S820]|uniref:Uncharacterized protein n=4 Tax=Felixounavirus TaxID=1198140 RepID=A0A7S9SPU2_9CAUD|nr:hypothetical protein [Salmonella phage SPT-1]EHG9666037.1 hypothetical protein [Salmonella enterica]QPI14069.1 hypothetical protein GECvBB1_gp028 [Salmonella phage GEC_vB_B1]QPI14217.1 hypothetical protein GECvBBS_gp028 [Salmonella phage GEC_vB_BS]WMI36755.1 hypothetical protein [Salmonella phage SUT_S720]WMI36843.1 hypothetical protein [Salmonella phage SUT_S820]WMI36962.1 hypothetical protein [Salmonella phage SUT_S920]